MDLKNNARVRERSVSTPSRDGAKEPGRPNTVGKKWMRLILVPWFAEFAVITFSAACLAALAGVI